MSGGGGHGVCVCVCVQYVLAECLRVDMVERWT